MTSNLKKLPLQRSLNAVAINRSRMAIENLGRALPCRVTAVTGAIVTVEFEMDTSPWTLPPITIPKAESPWVRMPTQVGDKGVTLPADVYLGGVSGLGGGTANFRRRGNYSTLVFVPISNSSSPPDDPNAAQVCGPNGGIMRTTTGTTSSVVTDTSGTTVTYGSNTISLNEDEASITVGETTLTITSSGITLNAGGKTFSFSSAGATMSNGVVVETHTHPYLPGSGEQTETGGPQ